MLGKFSDLKVWFLHKRDHKGEPFPKNANADIFKNVKRSSASADAKDSVRTEQNKLGRINSNTKIPTKTAPLEQTTTSSRLAGNDMPPFLTTNKYNPPAEIKDKCHDYPEVKDEYELSPPDEDHLYYSPGEPLTPRRKKVAPPDPAESTVQSVQSVFSIPKTNIPKTVPDGELSENTVLSGDDAEQKNIDLKNYQQEQSRNNEFYDTQTMLPLPDPQDNSAQLNQAEENEETSQLQAEATAGNNTAAQEENLPAADSRRPGEEMYIKPQTEENTPGSKVPEEPVLKSSPAEESVLSLKSSIAADNEMNKATETFNERIQEPIPELTKVNASEKYDRNCTVKIALPLVIYLYLRQIIAAFFTHTTLNIFFPRTALRLGPCYPSSMPLPYFVIGLVIGAATYWLQNIPDGLLPAVIALTLFVTVTGISGFRGVISMVSTFSKRQPDSCLQAVCVCFYSMLFTALYTVITMIYPIDSGFILTVAVLFMVSACAATSLNYGLRQNPIDFYGSLSLSGLLFCMLLTAVTTYAVLNPYMATSVLGIAMLIRVLCGQLLYLSHARASKKLVGGILYLVLICVFADILIFSSRIPLLNPLFFS